MHPEKWQQRFMELAKMVSSWSKDPSTKVGAVIVNSDKIVMGMGYNGFPRKVPDFVNSYDDRELKYKMILHAEVNAILNASGPVKDCTLYVWPFMACSRCAAQIIQSGISGIVFPRHPEGSVFEEVADRWSEDNAIANDMFSQVGVKVSDVVLVP